MTARRFVPQQHGAWAMLVVPWLAGVLVVGLRWPHLPLLGAWLAGYPLSYYALQAVKTRRLQRVKAQLALYGSAAAVLAAVVAVARPSVLLYLPAYAVLLAVNVLHARLRRERALLNDLASVAQSCLMLFVVASVAGVEPVQVVPAFLVVTLYFTGTVLYVKTMIRERGNVVYQRLSAALHTLALAVASLLGVLVVALFALLLVRAVALPRQPLTPKQVGIIEIVACVLVLVAAVTANPTLSLAA
ncbi:MAG TPA: YwiC-like family protein [Actinoplanes sp.]|nr:YwiC-like family protein [Actinoplanes sp.]